MAVFAFIRRTDRNALCSLPHSAAGLIASAIVSLGRTFHNYQWASPLVVRFHDTKFAWMETLISIYPDAKDLLATPVDDVIPVLLNIARATQQQGMFTPTAVDNIAVGANNLGPEQPRYPFHQSQAIDRLLAEAWSWIERHGLIARAPGINGRNGWMLITQAGEQIAEAQDLARMRTAAMFPKELIHHTIAEKVWRSLVRGDLDEAVGTAFKAVEEAIREAGGYSRDDYGVDMARKAFAANGGPLSDSSLPENEQKALGHFVAGALGYFKNPQSHRTVGIDDLRQAQEQVMIATNILRIIDSRR